MRLTSSAFRDQQGVPLRYTKDGANVSPPLDWSDLPERTRELALLFENITPQTERPFVQWILCKIPPEAGGLPEGFAHRREPDAPAELDALGELGGLVQGRNSLGNVGYDGPLGAAGRTVRYRFRLFALDAPLRLEEGLDKAELLASISEHVLDQADLEVLYERPVG